MPFTRSDVERANDILVSLIDEIKTPADAHHRLVLQQTLHVMKSKLFAALVDIYEDYEHTVRETASPPSQPNFDNIFGKLPPFQKRYAAQEHVIQPPRHLPLGPSLSVPEQSENAGRVPEPTSISQPQTPKSSHGLAPYRHPPPYVPPSSNHNHSSQHHPFYIPGTSSPSYERLHSQQGFPTSRSFPSDINNTGDINYQNIENGLDGLNINSTPSFVNRPLSSRSHREYHRKLETEFGRQVVPSSPFHNTQQTFQQANIPDNHKPGRRKRHGRYNKHSSSSDQSNSLRHNKLLKDKSSSSPALISGGYGRIISGDRRWQTTGQGQGSGSLQRSDQEQTYHNNQGEHLSSNGSYGDMRSSYDDLHSTYSRDDLRKSSSTQSIQCDLGDEPLDTRHSQETIGQQERHYLPPAPRMVQIFRSESGFGFSLVGSAEIGSYIADIKPGGPADGVAYRGDQILMIDDLKIDNVSYINAPKALKAIPVGSCITLIVRQNLKELEDFEASLVD